MVIKMQRNTKKGTPLIFWQSQVPPQKNLAQRPSWISHLLCIYDWNLTRRCKLKPLKREPSREPSNHVPQEAQGPDQIDEVDFDFNILGKVRLGRPHHSHHHSSSDIRQPRGRKITGQPLFIFVKEHFNF